MKKNYPLVFRFAASLLALVLFLYGVIQSKNFLAPLVFGILIAYLLLPIVSYLEKKKIPRILANLISIILAIAIVYGLGTFIYQQFGLLLEDFPMLRDQAIENIESLQENLENLFGVIDKTFESYLKETVNSIFQGKSFNNLFSATTGTVFRIAILPVYIFLFLYYRTKFAFFIFKIVSKKNRLVTIKILRGISKVAGHYMGGVVVVVFILCILNSAGLMIIGVKQAILLGVVSAIFNFIPYFGTLMGGSIPLIFVLLTTEQPLFYGIRVVILFIIIQFLENNILTPNIVGGYVKINPFFIIIGLVFGATVWGIPGMLLIVPILAILRIVSFHVKWLKPYAFLLGPAGTHKHSVKINLQSINIFKKLRNKKKNK